MRWRDSVRQEEDGPTSGHHRTNTLNHIFVTNQMIQMLKFQNIDIATNNPKEMTSMGAVNACRKTGAAPAAICPPPLKQ